MRDEMVEDEDGRRFRWPFCKVPGCPNRICRRLSDKWCWPHSMSGGSPAVTSKAKEKTDG